MTSDTLFAEALALSEPDREPYLLAHCPEDTLRRQVLRLLAAHARAGNFLADTPAASDTHPPADGDAPLPDTLGGRYRILGELGRGGMGVVYRAEQFDPILRAVAIKVVRPEAAARHLLARFEAERQTLAGLNHPNVAAVLDGGSTPDGRPFFVMEVVDGEPITRYCDSRRLPFADRLGLFLKLCDGVAHAHQRGVLHRDLKPGNVLVADADGRAEPKVIDFGVAKVLAPDAAPAGHTRPGTLVGTPQYMAPEQADLSTADLDTRADVYALAVLLYELTTGDTPLPAVRVQSAPLLDLLNAVRSEEAPPAGAKRRGLPQELDWVLAKGLSKDRDRRYGSVAEFAADLVRMTRHEAVSAAPTGGFYRVRKFLRRNWLTVGAAAAVLLAMAAGTAVSVAQMLRAQAAEQVAEKRRGEAEASATAATAAEAKAAAKEADARQSERDALRERDSARAMLHFFTDDLLALGIDTKQEERGLPFDPNIRLRAVIDAVAPTVGEKFAARPEVEAPMRAMIGNYYARIGAAGKAAPHLERAAELLAAGTGLADAERVRLHAFVGLGYALAGKPRTAREQYLLSQGLAARLPDPPPFVRLGLREGLLRADLTDRPTDALLDDADRLIADGRRELGDAHPLVASFRYTKAGVLIALAKRAEAVALLRELADDPAVKGRAVRCEVRHALAGVLFQMNDLKAAEPLLAEVVPELEAVSGADHTQTLESRYRLTVCRFRREAFADAGKGFVECREWYKRTGTEPDKRYVEILTGVAVCYRRVGDTPNAAKAFAAVAAAAEQVLGPADTTAATFRYNAANAYSQAGKPADAEAQVRLAVDGLRRLKKESWDVFHAALELHASLLCGAGKYEEAEKVAAECVERSGKVNAKSEYHLRGRGTLGAALAGQKKYADAEPLLLDAVKGITALRKTPKVDPADAALVSALTRLIDLYDKWGKADEAAKWKERLPAPPR